MPGAPSQSHHPDGVLATRAMESPADLETDTMLLGNNTGVQTSDREASAADLVPTLVPARPHASAADPGLALEGDQTRLFPSPRVAVSAYPQPQGSLSGNLNLNELDRTQLFNQDTQRLAQKATTHSGTTASTEGLTRV